MPILVELRERDGTVVDVTGEESDDLNAAIPEVDFDEYPLLAGIDRYGETVFNGMQMERLLEEISRMRTQAPPPKVDKLLTKLAAMCAVGKERAHMRLVFTGD
jgi:hypothetical protein